MIERVELTAEDEGQDVLGPDGRVLGRIERVERGRATVETDPAAADSVLTGLGWALSPDETVPIESRHVASRTPNAVILHDL
jgi:hypothetical protein